MEEENITIILDALLAEKDSCTMREVYDATLKYMEEHQDLYIDHSGDTIDYYLGAYSELYFWDYKALLIRKQESVKCKFCDKEYRKYPNTEKFEEIKRSNNLFFSIEDIHKAFLAGVNRGVFIATLIKKEPIEGDYPTYEQYIGKILKNE